MRKLVALERATWQAVDLLGRDSMKSFQELTDEAFRDLLKKHGRADTLIGALRRSAAAGGEAGAARPAANARPVPGGGAKKQRRGPSGRLQRG